MEEIPIEIKGGLEIIPVKSVDEVLKVALEYSPLPIVTSPSSEVAPKTKGKNNQPASLQ